MQNLTHKGHLQSNTVSLKKLHRTYLTSLNIIKDILQQHSEKPYSLYKFSRKAVFLVSDKTFTLHHFYAPKNCIFKALEKLMSLYFCKSL